MNLLRQNLETVRSNIEEACGSVGRDPSEVTLIAVSKTKTVDEIRTLYDLGVKQFGESKLQEAEPKISALPDDTVWHFIGKLQSNKARKVAELFDVIHTLESTSQLNQIAKAGKTIDGLVEVNIAEEQQKSGITVKMLDEFVSAALQCKNVHFRGLMTIGPAGVEAEVMRVYFRQLRKLNEGCGGQWLSMGMSDDYAVAIQEGATHVRVGTALFGARP